MRKLFFLLNFLLFASISYAVNINFTDEDFKNKLLNASTSNNIAKNHNGNSITIDVNNDDEISTVEAALVYELDISNASNIESIIGIQYFINLEVLTAESCNIATANLSNMVNLVEVVFKNNQTINSINISGCTGITKLDCKGNNLTTIDVSSLINLNNLDVSNNNLINAFIKNGKNEGQLNFNTNSTLQYVCADESQIANVVNQVGSSCVVNSYCSLPPGGYYNTITGKAVFDANNDGIDSFDYPQDNVKIAFAVSSDNLQTITSTSGNYTLMTNKIGTFTFAPVIENPSWFSVNSANWNFLNTNNNVRTQDFAITPIGTHHDVEVVIAPVGQALPGNIATYEVVYKNKGNQNHSGTIGVTFNDVLLDYVFSTAPLALGVGTLDYNYTNLRPFECRKFTFTVAVASSAPINAPLVFGANIDVLADELVADNSFTYTQRVVNTPTVNRIDCIENSLLPTTEIGNYLHYVINFMNTGNSTVDNVIVRTVFDPAEFDINSIQILDSTSPVDLVINNNEVLYQLRSAHLGGPGGQGGILLKIRTRDTLSAGETVDNSAQIFFDYSAGATTNTAVTTFQNLSVSENSKDDTVKVYPNPANDVINAEGDSAIKTIELYDIYGRLLQTNLINTNKTILDLSQRATGTYFLKITTEKGQKVEQIEKK